MVRWWYGAGWLNAWRNVTGWPGRVSHAFSIPILLKTLFAPWRRITTPPGSSLDSKIHAGVDNLVSRVVGMIVRFLVLIAAGLMSLFSFVAAVTLAVAWVFIPAAGLVLAVMGITG